MVELEQFKTADYNIKEKMKIGIITFHGADNYGAVLQAWALTKWLKKRGLNSEILDYQADSVYKYYNVFRTFRYKNRPVSFIADLLRFPFTAKRFVNFQSFRKRELPITDRRFFSNEELKEIEDVYDFYICGSDQIWNPMLVSDKDTAYFLDFVADNTKKISFAPSIAVDSLSDTQIAEMVKHISTFHAVSVREQESISLLQPYCINQIYQVSDPVFLLTKDDFSKLSKKAGKTSSYVFLYLVGAASDNIHIIQYAERIATEKKIKLIYLVDGSNWRIKIHGKNVFGCAPQKFLSLIKSAQYVISNSFHATAFSIIFQTQFIAFLKEGTGSRVKALLSQVGLENRICKNWNVLDLTEAVIDFEKIRKNLEKLKIDAEKYLLSALNIKEELIFTVPENELTIKASAYQNLRTRVGQEGEKYWIGRHRNDNIRKVSRSGGFFTALSDVILNEGGVVYGCKMNGLSRAIHTRAETKKERDAFCGSKYIQSEMGECFSQVKNDLSNGRTVLFSGTGCQVAGLRSFLKVKNADQSNLYTIDIICHGTPSPKIWKAYLEWIRMKYKRKPTAVNFRDKKYGWASHFETVSFSEVRRSTSVFRNLFYRHYVLRPSCYVCPFASLDRCSDITLGDAWGIQNTDSKLNDDKGCSLIILNSEKGHFLFTQVRDDVIFEKADINLFMQPNLKQPSYKPKERENFWALFKKEGFGAVEKKYGRQKMISALNDKMSIWIHTLFRG